MPTFHFVGTLTFQKKRRLGEAPRNAQGKYIAKVEAGKDSYYNSGTNFLAKRNAARTEAGERVGQVLDEVLEDSDYGHRVGTYSFTTNDLNALAEVDMGYEEKKEKAGKDENGKIKYKLVKPFSQFRRGLIHSGFIQTHGPGVNGEPKLGRGNPCRPGMTFTFAHKDFIHGDEARLAKIGLQSQAKVYQKIAKETEALLKSLE